MHFPPQTDQSGYGHSAYPRHRHTCSVGDVLKALRQKNNNNNLAEAASTRKEKKKSLALAKQLAGYDMHE